jgi:hypothetical protein
MKSALGRLGEVGDAAEVLFELLALAAHLQALALAHVLEGAVGLHPIDVGHFLHGPADGAEVGEHAAAPTLGDVRHAGGLHLLGDDVLGLLLRGHEEHLLAAAGHLASWRWRPLPASRRSCSGQ